MTDDAAIPGVAPHTFVVRLWFERDGDHAEGGEWRGEVRDVASRSVRHFRHLDGLTGAIRDFGLTGS